MPAPSSPSVRLILNTALLLTALGLVVRASGAVKEILFAQAFGVSAETDAFVLALTYATFLPTVVGGAIATQIIVEQAHATATSRSDLATLSLWVLAASCACALLIYALAGVAMSTLFNLSGEVHAKATSYARIMAPLGFLMVMSLAMSGVLNSAKQFYAAGISALGTPVFMMLGILAFSASWGVPAAVWGLVAGALVETVFLVSRIAAQRRLFFPRHTGKRPREQDLDFWRSVAVLGFAASVASVGPLVDQVFLAKLDTGAITHLNYAAKVNSLLIGLFGTAFGAAIYPYLSDLVAQRDIAGLKRLTWRLAAVVIPISGLTSLAVWIYSREIVELLFARGNFPDSAVTEVSAIQQVFAFQVVFYVGTLLAMRVLNAAGASRFALVCACTTVVANGLLDWLLYESMGARGIALATVLTSAISLGVALSLIRPALVQRG